MIRWRDLTRKIAVIQLICAAIVLLYLLYKIVLGIGLIHLHQPEGGNGTRRWINLPVDEHGLPRGYYISDDEETTKIKYATVIIICGVELIPVAVEIWATIMLLQACDLTRDPMVARGKVRIWQRTTIVLLFLCSVRMILGATDVFFYSFDGVIIAVMSIGAIFRLLSLYVVHRFLQTL